MDNNSSNNLQTYRGRGSIHKSNNTEGNDSTPCGRGQYCGRGRMFRDNLNDGCNKNIDKRFENDKITGPNIPLEINNYFSGIEAGQNIDKYETIDVQVNENDPPKSVISFPISCLPGVPIIPGRDLVACVQINSGLITAWVLPILQNLLDQPKRLHIDKNHCEPQVVIIAHWRKTVRQINDCMSKFCKGTHIINRYFSVDAYRKKVPFPIHGAHILTTKHGSLKYLLENGIITFSSVKFLVLHEADRLLNVHVQPIIEWILNHPSMPPNDVRQTLIFADVFSRKIHEMTSLYLKPDHDFFSGECGRKCIDVIQTTIKEVRRVDKRKTLLNLLKEMEDCQGTIVLVKQNRHADVLVEILCNLDFPSTSIHGKHRNIDIKQSLEDFKTNKKKILVATFSIALRLGIKEGVTCVVNYDLPETVDVYVYWIRHIGRLGNAGKTISFLDQECDYPIASELVGFLKQADQKIPSWLNNITERTKTNQAVSDFNDKRGKDESDGE